MFENDLDAKAMGMADGTEPQAVYGEDAGAVVPGMQEEAPGLQAGGAWEEAGAPKAEWVPMAGQVEDRSENSMGERLLDEQVARISRLDPGIRSFEDLAGMERFDDFDRLVRCGYDMVAAYKAVNYDAMARRGAAAARQAALNALAGARQLQPLPGGMDAGGGLEIPTEALRLWRQAFPGESDAQLRRRYNEAVSV